MTTYSNAAASAFSLRAATYCHRTHLPITLAEESPILSEVLQVWETVRHGRTMPSRADIDAFDFRRSTLPYLGMMSVEHDPFRFRYRLTGTNMDQVHDANLTGQYVDQIARNYRRDDLQPDLEQLVDRKVPQLVFVQFQSVEDYRREHRILRLPLSGGGPGSDPLRVDRILIAFEPIDPVSRQAFRNN
ncbi:PAS domain-containing protein [Pacificispira sp.]|uniref:PAS domain-containing protein n=1 Tax=Pacificispira sp. TaxID=2888761 RepID=UPI003BACBBDB